MVRTDNKLSCGLSDRYITTLSKLKGDEQILLSALMTSRVPVRIAKLKDGFEINNPIELSTRINIRKFGFRIAVDIEKKALLIEGGKSQ